MKTLEKRLLHHKRIGFSTGVAVNVLLFGKIEPKKYKKNTNTKNKKKTRKQILCFFFSTKHTSLIHQKGYATHRGPKFKHTEIFTTKKNKSIFDNTELNAGARDVSVDIQSVWLLAMHHLVRRFCVFAFLRRNNRVRRVHGAGYAIGYHKIYIWGSTAHTQLFTHGLQVRFPRGHHTKIVNLLGCFFFLLCFAEQQEHQPLTRTPFWSQHKQHINKNPPSYIDVAKLILIVHTPHGAYTESTTQNKISCIMYSRIIFLPLLKLLLLVLVLLLLLLLLRSSNTVSFSCVCFCYTVNERLSFWFWWTELFYLLFISNDL